MAGCSTHHLCPDANSDQELLGAALRIEQRQELTAERFRQQRARLSPEGLAQERSAEVLAPFEDAPKRASFDSPDQLEARPRDFIAYFNAVLAKPFRWTYAGKPLCE